MKSRKNKSFKCLFPISEFVTNFTKYTISIQIDFKSEYCNVAHLIVCKICENKIFFPNFADKSNLQISFLFSCS